MPVLGRLRSRIDGDAVLERRVMADGTEVFLCARQRFAAEPTYVVRLRAKGRGPAVVHGFADTRDLGQDAFDRLSRRFARGVA